MANQSSSMDFVNQPRAGSQKYRLATLIFGLMMSLPFLIPYHNLPIPSFQSEWLAMLLGVLGLLLIVLGKDSVPLHVPRIAIAPAALISIVVLQLASGMFAYPSSAFTISMYLLWCTLLAVAGRTLTASVGDRSPTSSLAWLVLAGGWVNALAGMLQYLEISQAFGGLISEPLPMSLAGVYGNLAQQNHFSTHIALSIVSASYLCFSRQLSVRWYVISAIALLISLVLSGSRSSFLYIGWIIFVSMWLTRSDSGHRAYRRAGWWAIGILSSVAAAIWIASRLSPMIPQIERLLSISSAIGPRVYLWKHAFLMLLENPLLGVGFDSFAYHLIGQLQEFNEPKIWGIDQYAHNLVLQLLAVSGLCGFVAIAWPGMLFLKRKMQASYTVESMWRWGVLGVLFIHSMLEQPLYYAYFLGIAALVAGMSDPQAWHARFGAKPKMIAGILLILALALLFKTANEYDNMEGHFYSGRHVDSEDAHQAELLQRKILLDLNTHSIFAPLSELIAPAVFVPEDALPQEKIKFNHRIRRYAPIAETEFRHAALLAEAGQLAEAKKQLSRAMYAYPGEAKEYLNRFNMLAAQDFAIYGALAAYANDLATQNGGKSREQ